LDALFHDGEEISYTTRDMVWVAFARNILAMYALARGDVANGQALIEEALAVACQSNSRGDLIVISENCVLPLLVAADSDRAATLAEEILELARHIRSRLLEVDAHTSLAAVAGHRGDGASSFSATAPSSVRCPPCQTDRGAYS
jgi:hypothetical protein